MKKTILGIPVEKLKKSKCYLTYEGANRLDACPEGLKYWKEKKWGKIEAEDVFERFCEFCVSCFVYQAFYYLDKSIVDDQVCTFRYFLCTCCDSEGEKGITWKNASKKDKERFVLLLRAIIIHASKHEKYGD